MGWRLFFSRFLVTASSIVLLTSCSGIVVPVKPPRFGPEELLQVNLEGVTLEVRPIEGYEIYWDLFDADLPQAGIAAVWVRIRNSNQGEVDLKDLRWSLRTATRSFSALDARKVLDLLYRGSRDRMHSLVAEQKSYRDLERVMLKSTSLPPSQSREGYVFLRIDPEQAAHWSRNGILVARGLRLQDRRKLQIEVPLTYAHP